MKVLITGASGFVGQHLTALLLMQPQVSAVLLLSRSPKKVEHPKAQCLTLDLQDALAVNNAVAAFQPDYIFHLAAQSSVAQSWLDPEASILHNVGTTKNLLEAAVKLDIKPRFLFASTAELYKQSSHPCTETSALEPSNPYAISKLQAEIMVQQFGQEFSLPFCIARAFNHIGPGQSTKFVVANFAQQFAKAQHDGKKTLQLEVGNLDVERDFLDVRDVVQAYWSLITSDAFPSIVNIASGQTFALKTLIDKMAEISKVVVTTILDETRLRPNDNPYLCGDNSMLKQNTEWQQRYTINHTLGDILASLA